MLEESDAADVWAMLDHAVEKIAHLESSAFPCRRAQFDAEQKAGDRVVYVLQPAPQWLDTPSEEAYPSELAQENITSDAPRQRLVPCSVKIGDVSNDLVRTALETVGLTELAKHLSDPVLDHFREHSSGQVFKPELLWMLLPSFPGDLEISVGSSIDTGTSQLFDEEWEIDEDAGYESGDPEQDERSDPAPDEDLEGDDGAFYDSVVDNYRDASLEPREPVYHSVYISPQPGIPCLISVELGQDAPKYDTHDSPDEAEPRFFMQLTWDYGQLNSEGIPEKVNEILVALRAKLAEESGITDKSPEMDRLIEPVGQLVYKSVSFPLGSHTFVINRIETALLP